jgi:hypothetical protein
MVSIFKRRLIEEIKQPQEYYCSTVNCINEVATFNPLVNLMTEEAYNEYAQFYCLDCITEERFNV